MTGTVSNSASPPTGARKNRRTFFLIGLVTLAPVVASYAIYYWFPPDRQVNYGELLPTVPAPPVAGTGRDGTPFALAGLRGKWVLTVAAPGGCDATCRSALYATRQARTIQGREMERVQRVWLVTDDAAARPGAAGRAPGPAGRPRVAGGRAGAAGPGQTHLLVDPLGNLVLAYPRDPDIKAMAKDITRLLKASRIG